MAKATLLVELLTEELPPKSLRALSEAFAERVLEALAKAALADAKSALAVYATPRRLAFSIAEVASSAPGRESDVTGPSANAPAQAIAGFARKHGLAAEQLERRDTPKGPVMLARVRVKGAALEQILTGVLEEALKGLPIQKVMRWGNGDAQFVRPVHGVVVLHGERVVPGGILSIAAGRSTSGHRFMGKRAINLKSADQYAQRLEKDGKVIAGFAARRAEIDRQLKAAAARESGDLGGYADLLDEVTALVEYPQVYAGGFDRTFLEVPAECLILTMRQHQKYFPLFDGKGHLLPRFLIVSNMQVADPRQLIAGNERVVRPRLEDARFFYNQDRKVRLETRVPQLAKVVYHSKLGSQLQRVQRIQLLAGHIARAIGIKEDLAERAAWLAKADLLTAMVGEFPELQGIMGSYYARHGGEPEAVCNAIGDQYRMQLSALADPTDLTSVSLYLADRIDALVGLFGVGETPTGEKDPFALRRAAQGVIRTYELVGAASALIDRSMPDVRELLEFARTLFPPEKLASNVVNQVHDFILERCWNNLATIYPKQVVEAVISQRPKLVEINARVQAVQSFLKLPEAESLAVANKRIRNILRKSEKTESSLDVNLLKEPEEQRLFESVRNIEPEVYKFIQAGNYAEALKRTATIEPAVSAFFEKVMVNAEDLNIRANRHALLRQKLDPFMNQVADISKLAVEK